MPGADSFLKPFSSQLLQMEDNSGRWKLVPELVAPGAIPSCSSRAALPSSECLAWALGLPSSPPSHKSQTRGEGGLPERMQAILSPPSNILSAIGYSHVSSLYNTQ